MAKNWTLKEARQVIAEGTDKAAIQELGKKFPLTSVAIAKMGTNEGIRTLFGAMPEHMTMLKMERALKDGIEDSDDEDVSEDVASEDTNEAADTDLSSMTTKQLYELCIKRGIKANKYGKPKSYYVDLLKGDGDKQDEPDNDEDEAEKEDEYAGKSAIDLFKLCKKRGIKVEPKQKASVYIAALKKDDAAAEEPEEDDDWDDEEEEKESKQTKSSKPAKQEKKKAADDDDDDWDI